MLNFPFYSFGYSILFPVFIGIIILSVSIYQLFKGNKEGEKEYFNNSIGILAGTVFLLCGAFFSIGNLWSTYNFRNIDISKVKGFKIAKSADEYSQTKSHFIIFDNAQQIQEALKSLKNCGSIQPDHEHFENGYKLQLLFTDENFGNDYFISVYKRTNRSANKSAVIPHFFQERNLNLGEYDCPAFQDWVSKFIDPLFQEKENKTK